MRLYTLQAPLEPDNLIRKMYSAASCILHVPPTRDDTTDKVAWHGSITGSSHHSIYTKTTLATLMISVRYSVQRNYDITARAFGSAHGVILYQTFSSPNSSTLSTALDKDVYQ